MVLSLNQKHFKAIQDLERNQVETQ